MKNAIFSLLVFIASKSSIHVTGDDAADGDDDDEIHDIDFVCYNDKDCENGGKCRPSTLRDGGFCDCPKGFQARTDCSEAGEFQVAGCDLKCKNGGSCAADSIEGTADDPVFTCACIGGWGGPLCETKVEVCEDSTTVCGFSSRCRLSTNPTIRPPRFYCACAEDAVSSYCQNLAAENAVYTDQPSVSGPAPGVVVAVVLSCIVLLFAVCRICGRRKGSQDIAAPHSYSDQKLGASPSSLDNKTVEMT
jgi:hypothetical protein